MKYVVLLRGINVGGNNMIKMSELKDCLTQSGFRSVNTYIQSGNVLLESDLTDKPNLTDRIQAAIKATFGLSIPVVVLSADDFKAIVAGTPKDWNDNADWKYNFIFLKRPYSLNEVMDGVGELKPGIESITVGQGVLYQSMSKALFGRTTTGKLASKPVYQMMTIRNHNTVTKLAALLDIV